MVRAVSAFDGSFLDLSSDGLSGSQSLFQTLLEEIKQGGANNAGLSPQLLDQIVKDVHDKKLSLEQAIELILMAEQNGQQGSQGAQDSQGAQGSQGSQDSQGAQGSQGSQDGGGANDGSIQLLTQLLDEAAGGKIPWQKAAQLIDAALSGQGDGQTGSTGTVTDLVAKIVEAVADKQITSQTGAQLIEGVASGQVSPNEVEQLIEAAPQGSQIDA
jgi:hypothetical protein